jgi:transposase IS116/IS110/IS902 family protein
VGLVPEEKSSGDRRRLGHISKQGNALLRFLLVEAAQVTIRSQAQWRSKFFHLAHAARTEDRQGSHGPQTGGASVLDVAAGLGLRQFKRFGSYAGEPGHPDGKQ